MRSGGVIYIELREKFNDSAANTAWVISLAVTVRMLFGKYESLLEHGLITKIVLLYVPTCPFQNPNLSDPAQFLRQY